MVSCRTFLEKSTTKNRRFECLREMDRAKDELLHSSNIRMRPFKVKKGRGNILNCNILRISKI